MYSSYIAFEQLLTEEKGGEEGGGRKITEQSELSSCPSLALLAPLAEFPYTISH